jgi:hypothetical protein
MPAARTGRGSCLRSWSGPPLAIPSRLSATLTRAKVNRRGSAHARAAYLLSLTSGISPLLFTLGAFLVVASTVRGILTSGETMSPEG